MYVDYEQVNKLKVKFSNPYFWHRAKKHEEWLERENIAIANLKKLKEEEEAKQLAKEEQEVSVLIYGRDQSLFKLMKYNMWHDFAIIMFFNNNPFLIITKQSGPILEFYDSEVGLFGQITIGLIDK